MVTWCATSVNLFLLTLGDESLRGKKFGDIRLVEFIRIFEFSLRTNISKVENEIHSSKTAIIPAVSNEENSDSWHAYFGANFNFLLFILPHNPTENEFMKIKNFCHFLRLNAFDRNSMDLLMTQVAALRGRLRIFFDAFDKLSHTFFVIVAVATLNIRTQRSQRL